MGLVLGSASPRRREILAQLGLSFRVVPPNVDEAPAPGESPDAYLHRIVLAKLDDVGGRVDAASIVLCADTEVVQGDVVMGKPSTDDEARSMLFRLSDLTHHVVTMFAIRVAGHTHVERVLTHVTFRALAKDEIEAYVTCGEGRDKAGGYAIQGRGAMLVSRIEGSYSNVVGLPACEVWLALRRLGAT